MNDISPKEHYQNLRGYKPKYANPGKKKEEGLEWLAVMLIAFIFLAFYVRFHTPHTQIAQAAEVSGLAPELLDQKQAACDFLELYPEKVRNLQDAKRDCLSQKHATSTQSNGV